MIRKHQAKDLETIMEIWYKSSSIAHPFLGNIFVEKVKKDMRELYIPNSDTWIFEENGITTGFISMVENVIVGLFVLPIQQSKGVGTKLVNYVNKFNPKLTVEVFKENTIGRAFYDKYGFSVSKEYMHKESDQLILIMKYN